MFFLLGSAHSPSVVSRRLGGHVAESPQVSGRAGRSRRGGRARGSQESGLSPGSWAQPSGCLACQRSGFLSGKWTRPTRRVAGGCHWLRPTSQSYQTGSGSQIPCSQCLLACHHSSLGCTACPWRQRLPNARGLHPPPGLWPWGGAAPEHWSPPRSPGSSSSAPWDWWWEPQEAGSAFTVCWGMGNCSHPRVLHAVCL